MTHDPGHFIRPWHGRGKGKFTMESMANSAIKFEIVWDGDLWELLIDGEHHESYVMIDEACQAIMEYAKAQ